MNTINPNMRMFSTDSIQQVNTPQTAKTEAVKTPETPQQEIRETADLSSGKPAKDLNAEKLRNFAATQAVTTSSEVEALPTTSEVADMALSTSIQTAGSMVPSTAGTTIRLLFTDDLHGAIFSSPMWGRPDVEQGGMSMLKSAIDENRDENTLLLDAGDWAQGTYPGGMDKGVTVVDLMSKLGYDAAAIGNHEFDWGREQLTQLAQQATFDVLGANANFTYKISDDFLANFGLFGGNMRYAGPFDEFSGIIYGADFGAKYETSDVFARLQGMFTLVKFDDVLVFDGTNSVNNPTGIGTGMGLDLGPVFSVYDSQIKIKPFVGVNVGYVSITGDKKADVNAKIGLDAEFIKIIDGNKYGYGAKTFVQTDGAVYGGVFANMLSVADGVGGVLDAALLNDDNGLSYKVSLGINFIF